MLRLRVYTAIALAAIFFGTLILPPDWRAVAMSVPFLIGYWEFLTLCNLRQSIVNTCVAVLSLTIFSSVWFFSEIPVSVFKTVLSGAATLWAIIFLWVMGYPGSAKIWGHKYFKLMQATVLILAATISLSSLSFNAESVKHLIFIVALVAAADIGAYFSGKQFGKHKLAANVSPGKTWEGFTGGLSLVIIVSVSFFFSLDSIRFLPFAGFLILVMMCSCFSVVGDLYESMIKRQVNAKDSSTLLPGHGGMLDRIDGLMPAITLYGFAVLHAGA